MTAIRRIFATLSFTALVLLITAALIWWQLPNYLQSRVNNRLAELEKHTGNINDLTIDWLQGEVLFHDLTIRRRDAIADETALLQAPKLTIDLHSIWPQELSTSIVLQSPKLQLAVADDGSGNQLGLGEDWVALVEDIVPLPVKKAEIHDGEARTRLRLSGDAEPFAIALLNIEASAEHKKAAEELVASITGNMARGGQVEANVTSNAQSPGQNSTAVLQLQKTALAPYNPLLRHYGDIDVADGQYAVNMHSEIKDRQVTGTMDVRLSNLDVLQFGSDAPLSWLFEGFVGGMAMLVGKGPNNKIELEIPISGELNDVSIESAGQLRQQVTDLLPSLDDWSKLIPADD